jgi:hypothetical protein
MDAARAVDAQEGATTAPEAPAPVLRNAPRFDDFSQGLAGTLIAEKNKLDRIREDLTDQMLTAQRTRDAEFEAAKAAYDARVKDATDAFTEANAMLEAKATDAIRAQGGIQKALDALT